MWMLTCFVLFGAGYTASVYSWPTIKACVGGMAVEAGRLRDRVVKRKAKSKDI